MSDVALTDESPVTPPVAIRSADTAARPDPLMARLESRIAWYDRSARKSQRLYRGFKVFTLLAAAAIPFASALGAGQIVSDGQATLVAGLLGAAIVVVEGLQQLFQWQQNWMNYRSTCESLEREQALYLAPAGEYLAAQQPRAFLAERVEAIMTQEHSKWVTLSEQSITRRSDAAAAESPPSRR